LACDFGAAAFACDFGAAVVSLAFASGLAAFCGGWLFVQDHRGTDQSVASDEAASDEAEPYLPTVSWWPLVVGFGAALALNGLILSWQYALPGVAVLAIGIVGMVNDSRQRT